MRESVKRVTNWSPKYFTHQRSFYPVPEVAMDLCNVLKLDPIPVVSMDRADIVKMREFSAGTLPLTAYSVELRQDPLDTNVEEEVTEEYDSDSDLSLSGDEAEEDKDDEHAVPHTLTTRHGKQIRAVVRLDL